MILGTIKQKDTSISYQNDAGCLIGCIADAVENVGLPMGNVMDREMLNKMFYQNIVKPADIMDALVETTNALLDIRNMINAYYED